MFVVDPVRCVRVRTRSVLRVSCRRLPEWSEVVLLFVVDPVRYDRGQTRSVSRVLPNSLGFILDLSVTPVRPNRELMALSLCDANASCEMSGRSNDCSAG